MYNCVKKDKFVLNFQKKLKIMTSREFNNMVLQFHEYLKPFAMRLTQDKEEAKDLLQETMTKAIANKDKFMEGTNLKAWLYTIMKNTFITHYHRVMKRNTVVDTTDNLHLITLSGNITYNSALGKLTQDDIEEALDELNYKYKTPFQMYHQGYKYHEIADILNIPIGTVKNRIHVARKELKKRLASYAR